MKLENETYRVVKIFIIPIHLTPWQLRANFVAQVAVDLMYIFGLVWLVRTAMTAESVMLESILYFAAGATLFLLEHRKLFASYFMHGSKRVIHIEGEGDTQEEAQAAFEAALHQMQQRITEFNLKP